MSKNLILCISLLGSLNSLADQGDYYARLGGGLILDQTEKFDRLTKKDEPLYYSSNDKLSYSIDIGKDLGHYQYGISSTGLINQGESSYKHKPYKVELFIDYKLTHQGFGFVVGSGYKIKSQESITFSTGKTHQLSTDIIRKNRFTARFGVYKRIDDWEIGLAHHSQWFVGRPFNNDWEYHKTEVVISKYF